MINRTTKAKAGAGPEFFLEKRGTDCPPVRSPNPRSGVRTGRSEVNKGTASRCSLWLPIHGGPAGRSRQALSQGSVELLLLLTLLVERPFVQRGERVPGP